MARDFKEIPKSVFLTRQAMKKFTDCLNKSGIFNQKIPYLVIHQKERYYGSELELKLTFKEDIKNICTSKDANERDKQLTMYILKKLNSVPNFKFDLANKVFIDMLDKTDKEVYKKYLVAYFFGFSDDDENKPITNSCNLVVRIYKKDIPLFEIYLGEREERDIPLLDILMRGREEYED